MESPPGLQGELQRLVDQATDLSGMNQLSRTLLQLLHDEKDATNQRVIKEAILLLAQKAVDAKKALEQKVTPSDAPDVACQVIFCVRDVKVHRINNGTSELLETADMHVVLVSTEFGHEMAFVEVGNFHYPLTPAIPCLRSLGGSYILALQDDVFYGLSLPDGIHEAYVQAFDRILTALADFRIESTTPAPPESAPPTPTPVAPEVHIADRVAASLEAGAERLSTGIENTSALLVAGIEASQGFLKERIRPLEEPMSVNPFVSLALRGAASGSGYVVAVKPVVIEKFVSIARFIGRQTVAWIPRRSQGEGNGGAGGASATAPLVKVGGAALLSATRVWESLSKAGDQLVVSTGKTAAALVSHRYGAEAGAAAEHAVAAVRNTMDVYNTRPTQIIKSVALAGGKASVKEYLAQKPSKEA